MPPIRNQSQPTNRRAFLQSAGTLLATGTLAYSNALAQSAWPAKPIKLVIPFAPGGVTDTSGRIIAEFLGKRLGQQVVPDNRPGASGNIGSQVVASAEPDGYTLLLVLDGTFVINPHVYDKVPFDPQRDFATIGKIGDSTTILVAHPGFKANNMRELIDISKALPGGVSYGTSGTGSIVHLAGELLKQRTGANLVHIPYKGGAPAIADALAGHTPLAFASAASISAAETGSGMGLGWGFSLLAAAAVGASNKPSCTITSFISIHTSTQPSYAQLALWLCCD